MQRQILRTSPCALQPGSSRGDQIAADAHLPAWMEQARDHADGVVFPRRWGEQADIAPAVPLNETSCTPTGAVRLWKDFTSTWFLEYTENLAAAVHAEGWNRDSGDEWLLTNCP